MQTEQTKTFIIKEEQLNEFAQACLPVMKWLRDNCHPHVTVIVDSGRAELLEGLAATIFKEDPRPQPESQPESTEAQPESQPYSEPHPQPEL